MNATFINKKSLLVAAVILTLFGVSANVDQVVAGSNTGSLAVSANVNANCLIQNTGNAINFGAYDPLVTNLSSPLDQTGSFNVKCTKGTSSTLALDNGLHNANAAGTTRAMSDGGSNYLSYELYTTAGRTTVWNASNLVPYVAATSAFVPQTVYGRVPGGQDAAAGNYTDTVTITVNF